MTLSISDLVYDEQFVLDDNDSAGPMPASITSALSGLTFYSSPSGFPQYAEKANFVSDNQQQITDYFLTGWSAGGQVALSTTTGLATGLSVGSTTIYLFATSDPNVIIGRVGSTTSDPVALVIGLDETSTGGVISNADIWVKVYAPLVHTGTDLVDDADTLSLSNLVGLGAHYNATSVSVFDSFASVPSGQDAFAEIAPTGGSNVADLLVTGFSGQVGGTSGGTAGTVNVSTAGSFNGSLGSNSQAVDPGESLRIDTVTGANFSTADTAPEVSHVSNIHYTSHLATDWASFGLSQVNPSGRTATLSVFAYNSVGNAQDSTDTSPSNFPNTALSNEGTEVTIAVADVTILDASNHALTSAELASAHITIVQDPTDSHGVKISGLPANYQVMFNPDGDFERFVVTNTSSSKNSTFDIGHIKVATVTPSTGTEYSELGSHLIFEDGGPSITTTNATASITVSDALLHTPSSADFSGLWTTNYGPDGAGSTTYSVGATSAANSGLIDTATGNMIFLYIDTGAGPGGTDAVVGRVGNADGSANPLGAEVFTITADPTTAEVSLQQDRAVYHDTNTHDTSVSFATNDLVTLTATAADSETNADTASSTVGIGLSFTINDDVPVINSLSDLGPLTNSVNTTASGDADFTLGNDLVPSGQHAWTITGAPSGTNGLKVTFDDAGHQSITGTESVNGADVPFYNLTIDDNGHYTFTLLGALPSVSEGLSSTIIHAGGPANAVDVQAAAPSTDYAHIVAHSTVGAGLVNASHGFVGVDNGNLDNGESLTLSLHRANGDMFDVSGIDIGTKSAGISHYDYFVHMSDGSDLQVGNDVTVGKNGVIHVSDPNPNDNILIETITVFKVDGNAIKIGLGDIHFLLPPQDTVLNFDLKLSDGDHDSASSSFSVSLDGDGDGFIVNPISYDSHPII